ncbi:copper resistance CopC/CopD family protein [Haematobacter sp. UBA3484]|uniref:copper resistance CopC/CopD family protein n=1 Tax=Haematobacter sp. UBA3484 TaxID=1946582 RepID=UPI0025BE9097|nr:copper resistance protein CopC [Haematobacter sp. UBA3484]
MLANPPPRPVSRRLHLAALLLLGLLLPVLLPGRAEAHAGLISVTPPDGMVLEAAPSEVTLTFDEPVRPLVARLTAPDGRTVLLENAHVAGDRVTWPLPALPGKGSHVLSWRATAADGHALSGGTVFSIGEASGGPPVETGTPLATRLGLWIARAGLLAATLLAVGGRVFAAFSGGGRWGTGKSVALLGLGLLPLVAGLQGLDLLGLPLAALLTAPPWAEAMTGPARLASGLTALALLVSLAGGIRGGAAARRSRAHHVPPAGPQEGAWRAEAPPPRRAFARLTSPSGPDTSTPDASGHDGSNPSGSRRDRQAAPPADRRAAETACSPIRRAERASALLALALTMAAAAVTGHAATAPPQLLMRPAVALHVLGAVLWLGMLLPLAASLRAGEAVPLRRFSVAAPVVVALLVASGAAIATVQLGRAEALFTTSYGKVLLVKLGLVLAMLGLAALNRFRFSASPEHLRRSIAAEAVLGLLVIATLSLWRFTPPPRSLPPPVMPALQQIAFPGSDGLSARLTVAPGVAGPVTVVVDDVRRAGQRFAPQGLHIEFSKPAYGLGPFGQDLHLGQPTRFVLPLDGFWVVRLTLRLSDFENREAKEIVTLTPG